MATGTYNSNSTTAEYGNNNSNVLALQQAINNASQGQQGYVPLALDSKYGDKTKAAYDALVGQGYSYSNGAFGKAPTPAATPSTNPVVSSTQYGAGVNALGQDIQTAYDSSGLNQMNDANTKLIQDQMSSMDKRRADEIAGIKASYEEAARQQGARQNQDYAGRSTGLVTSGGGFLGTTQSQQGVLQNMKVQFDQEKQALMGKRDAAIQQAQNAYDDKNFALAQQLISQAKSTEQELYNRQKDFADQQLALTKEHRAQQEFDMGIADKKIEAYSIMDDAEFARQNPNDITQIDKSYYPGYTNNARKISQQASEAKSQSDRIKLDMDIYDTLSKVPAGTKVNLGGKTYIGLKPAINTGTKPLKGVITISRAQNAGLPESLVGMNENDIILSMEMAKPAKWFIDNLKANWQIPNAPLDENTIKAEWEAFRNDPDIASYRNTAKLDARHSINSGDDPLANLNISAEDIAAALNEE